MRKSNRKSLKRLFFITFLAALAFNCGACAKSTPGAKEKEEPQENSQSVTSGSVTGAATNPTDAPTATPTELPVETTPSTKSFLPTEDYVKLLGRAAEVENTLWLVHSGTGMEFTFTGTSATIKVKPTAAS